MKKVVLLLAIMSAVTLTITANEYIDPQTNVVYTYELGQATASVKSGYQELDLNIRDMVYYPGSPDAAGDVVILERFTVGTDEYVVTSIGEGAFRENGNIKSISIPETVKDIGAAAFASCNSLTTVQLPVGLTQIGPELFRGSIQLVSVAIPSSVSTIDYWAFGGCTSLTDLTLPENLTVVGRYAFYGTPWYAEQYNKAPEGLFYIGSILFGYKGDKPTGELVIKEGTTCIGFEAFKRCNGLTSVTIPSSVNYVDYGAFEDCTGLQAVHITDLVAWCGIAFQDEAVGSSSNPLSKAHHLYLNGEEVTDLVIPEGVNSIGDYAFDYCTALTSVTIPDGVTTIGTKAFRGCESLKNVIIPSSITTIGGNAFIWCFNLEAVHISDLAAWCGISFYWTANPLYYGAHLFLNGNEVTDLVIPEGVASIGDGAFRGCSSLISVTIPNSINNIGEYAFSGCRGLTNVISQIEEPFEFLDNVFEMYYDEPYERYFISATLYVPKGCKERYESTAGWKRFSKIIEDDYHPFLKEGKTWKFEEYYHNVWDDEEWTKDVSYVINGTTEIDGKTYYKMYRVSEEGSEYNCALREEDKKVWKYSSDDGEKLLYDFNMSVGDSYMPVGDWRIFKLVAINPIRVHDVLLNAFHYDVRIEHTAEIVDVISVPIVEGVGCSKGWNLARLFSQAPTNGIIHRENFLSCCEDGKCIFTVDDFYNLPTPKPVDDMTYRPFVEDGKVWKVGTIPSTPESPVQVVDYYYFDGDTIIDGKTCKQMWCQRYVNPDYPDYSALTQTPSLSKVGAWYEEDKKVYVCREGTQGMQMLYDFSLNANDTLQSLNVDGSSPFIIGPRQTGGIDGFKGVYRDIMMSAAEGQNIHSTFWLEGIGDINGPTIIPCDPILGDPVPEFLMSCTVGDEVIYLNDEYEDGATPEGMTALKKRFDFTHTTKLQPKAPVKRENSDASISSSEREVARPKVKTPRRTDEELSLYGEYNDKLLGINLDPLDDAYQVSITNESGKVVYEKTINAGTIVGLSIDISAYAKGRYTVTVENSNELFTGEFDTETTGIEETIYNKVETKTEIYNLQGQRIHSLQKGLNIYGGRKIVK